MMWWLPKLAAAVLAVSQPVEAPLALGAEALCPNQVEGVDDEELNCRVAAIVRGPGGVEMVLLREAF